MNSIDYYKSKKFLTKFNELWNEKCNGYDNLPNKLPPVERIIVLGDIHGDFDVLLECLIKADVINSKTEWIGGNTVVVQVGDQIDSCRFDGKNDCSNPKNIPKFYNQDLPNDIKILKFMTDLHKKAQEKGGAIYSLIGNHELMNVTGDMNYVSYSNIISHSSTGNVEEGIKNRKALFSPGNEMANFLACTRKIALIIGDNLFVHAGIVPYITEKYGLDDINRILTLFLLKEFDNTDIIKELLMSSHSPLWTRVFGKSKLFGKSKQVKDNCDELMDPLKKIYQVGRIYVGHTPQLETGIQNTCEEKIWLTDAAMPAAFNKFDNEYKKNGIKNEHRHAQVLEILTKNGKTTFTTLK
jgi:hypothetical protein